MLLLSSFTSQNFYNMTARLNDSLSIFMSANCGLQKENPKSNPELISGQNPKLKKFISYRLTSQIGVKFLLLLTVIIIGILSACFTTLNGEEAKDSENSVNEEELYRNPFSLPPGVGFIEKEKKEEAVTYSTLIEWKEGVVASSVSGIFQSGRNTMANINGIWVKEGDWVGEEQVTDINKDNVVLSGKDGEKRTLSLQGVKTEVKVIKRVKPKSKEKK